MGKLKAQGVRFGYNPAILVSGSRLRRRGPGFRFSVCPDLKAEFSGLQRLLGQGSLARNVHAEGR